jgi:hypothetical protein
MRRRWLIGVIAVALGTSAAQAGFVELGLSDETVDFRGGLTFGKSIEEQFVLGGRYLWHDLNDDADAKIPAVLVGFSSRPTNNDEFAYTAGVQFYLGEAADQDVQGMALGTSVAWNPGGWKGIYLGGRVWWSGSGLCFGDTDTVFEWAVRGGYAINKAFRVYVEYIDMEFDTEDIDNIEVVEEAIFGVSFDW